MAMGNHVRVPSIAIVGGGVGGICAAVQLKKQFPASSYSLRIFDENENFGGTWWANRYPGAACDAPSHVYSFSFELNPNWPHFVPGSSEIRDYVCGMGKKYGLYDHTSFSTQVLSLEWLESKGEWRVVVQNILDLKQAPQVLFFNYVFVAVGSLRSPKIPPEFLNFSGTLLHSARWDSSVDLSRKVVGVVGSGSSAVQIIPAISSLAKEVHSYQREAAWALPRLQFKVSKFTRTVFEKVPFLMSFIRWSIVILFDVFLWVVFLDRGGRYLAAGYEALIKFYIWVQVKGDRELVKKLTPKYRFGCKRIPMTDDYYPAFTHKHVHLHNDKIEKIQGNLITTSDGTEQNLDVLILATGFQVQNFFAPLQIKTSGGEDLLSKWLADGPNCFLGMLTSDTPNLFFIIGPNSLLAHNSLLLMIEYQVNFLLQLLKETERKGAKSVTVSKRVEEVYMDQITSVMKNRVWQTAACGSWYKNERNMVTTLWPYSLFSYWWALKRELRNKRNFSWTFDEIQ